MRLFLLFASGLADLVPLLGKLLFILTAPMLLIVAGSYYRTGHSLLEPLLGLVLVSGVFAGTHRFAVSLKNFRHHAASDASKVVEDSLEPVCNETGHCVQNRESESRQLLVADEETRRRNRRRAELWKQANSWGGFNPYD